MRHLALLIASTAFVALAVQGAAQPEAPHVAPARIDAPPRIDGRLDDAAWANAAVIADIPTPDSPEGRRTSVRLAYDDLRLYLGWVCFEPEMSKLVTACSPSRDKGWGDDSIEVFLQPRPPRGAFFQIIVNAANVLADSRYDEALVRDLTWDGSTVSAVTRDADVWYVEMAIPWADLELTCDTGPTMGLHFARWQPIPRGVNSHWGRPGHPKNADPKAFGRMDGISLEFDVYAVTAHAPRLAEGLCFGTNRIPVDLANAGDRPRKLRLEGEASWTEPEQEALPAAPRRFEIAPGEQLQVAVDLTTTKRQGTVCGRVRLVDEETGQVLRRMVRYAPVPEKLLQIIPSRRYLYASDETFNVLLYAFIGETSLKDHVLRVTHPSGGDAPVVSEITLTDRAAEIPVKTSQLPLGSVPITFEVLPVGGGEPLDRVETTVVRLNGPFDD